ncbi:MAG TPA: hypothetical protein VE988_08760, partial [Gemmataceae bacterium]|nr:hypothetical protein [Gemmataceae bacterium]
KTSGKITSIYDLMDTGVQVGQTIYLSPMLSDDPASVRSCLPDLWNKTMLTDDTQTLGRINVLTASPIVLATLPGLTEDMITAITGARPDFTATDQTNPIFQTPTWLVTEAGLTPTTLKLLDKYITCPRRFTAFSRSASLKAADRWSASKPWWT